MSIVVIFEEYAKHAALNFGQALHGARYFFSHPTIDQTAHRGTFEHAARSASLRSRRFANDLFFALIPPHWHHSPEELAGMRSTPMSRWFQYGYCAWRFREDGRVKHPLPADIDKRWDPRCDD